MRQTARTLLTLSFFLGIGACVLPTTPLPPLPTDTPPQPTHTSTPTIIWFPPTETPTPPSIFSQPPTPTTEALPPHGEVLFQDRFEEATLWETGKSYMGSIAFGKNELTIVITREKGYVYSLRKGTTLDDFYAEITAQPTICRGGDEYGILFRVSPSLEFLRFGLSCDGKARVDRYYEGSITSAQPPMVHGAVPPGAPSVSRLAIWANGREIRFYANSQHLFSIREAHLLSGGFGVFVRAQSSTMVTVNFSDLIVYRLGD